MNMSKSNKSATAWKGLVDPIDRTIAAPAAWANKSANSIMSVVRTTIGLAVIVTFPALAQTPEFVESPSAYDYDRGVAPSVAMSGTSIVEVHRGDANAFGPLWCRSGRIQPDGILNWFDSFQYDKGSRPSVAVSGINVIEVHEGTANGFDILLVQNWQTPS
jgi:hypothetical protein